MDDQQSDNQSHTPDTANDEQQGAICDKCGQNPCVCASDEDSSNKVEDDKHPPKVRWI